MLPFSFSLVSFLETISVGFLGFVCFVGFERDLQNSVPEAVSVQAGNGHGRLVVISHGDKTKSFALVCVEVADDLDVCNGAERPEHLPQDAFVRVWSQVVDEDAPAGPRVPRDVDASQTGHPVNGHGGEPAEKNNKKEKSQTWFKAKPE